MPCFILVVLDVRPRHIRNPVWMRESEFTDPDVPIKICYHRDIASIFAMTESGRIVIRKINANRFKLAFFEDYKL